MNGHRYIDEFIRLKCAPDLLALGLFPNGKEITESMAAYAAVRQHLVQPGLVRWDDEGMMMVCTGDGHTPRTAALFAFRSRWRCLSNDPALYPKERYDTVSRLYLFPQQIEVMTAAFHTPVVIVLVHAHVTLSAVLDKISVYPRHLVAIPCCVPQELPGREPDVLYRDMDIWSPKNEVRIWKNL